MRGLLARARRRLLGPGIARAVAGRGAGRHALLEYTVRAFHGRTPAGGHQNVGQQRELAAALGELGHEVDVVDFDERRRGLLTHDYDLVVDLHPREGALHEGRLRPGALRIAYITGVNPDYSNAAETRRLADLEQRRGVRLRPRRQHAPFPRAQIEGADAFFCFGDRRVLDTYTGAFRLPPAYRLFNHGFAVEPTDPARRDPKRFLFLGSGGMMVRGLDLLLEVFAGEPDLELVVCGPYAAEEDFVRAYRRELFHTPNIRAAGYADVTGAAFRDLQATCGHLVYPTAGEGQSGTVAVALSFGLPCAVSTLCGYDDPELIELPDCRLETLRTSVRALAATPRPALAERARASAALARQRYSAAHYAAGVRAALRDVLATRGVLPAGAAAPCPPDVRWEVP